MKHRVLICGDRNWTDIEKILDEIIELGIKYGDDLVIVEGEARGADRISRLICEEIGVEFDPYPAEWSKYRKAAGPIRNTRMLKEGKPDEVIAFHSNIESSTGTKNMMDQAEKAGLKVRLVT